MLQNSFMHNAQVSLPSCWIWITLSLPLCCLIITFCSDLCCLLPSRIHPVKLDRIRIGELLGTSLKKVWKVPHLVKIPHFKRYMSLNNSYYYFDADNWLKNIPSLVPPSVTALPKTWALNLVYYDVHQYQNLITHYYQNRSHLQCWCRVEHPTLLPSVS